MKLTAFDRLFSVKVSTGGTTLGYSTGSNSASGDLSGGGDVVGTPGDYTVVGLRSLVSLGSNMGDNSVGSVLTTIQSSPWIAKFAMPSNSGSFELRNEGGQSFIDDDSFPNAGATGDYDPTDGNVFTRTLNANHVGTILEPVGSGASTLEWWIATGAGGFTFDLDADGGTVTGDISAHTQTAGETFRVIAERIPGSTNDWIVDLVGGGGGASFDDGADPEPVALVADPGDDIYAARRDHVHDIAEATVRDIGRWEPVTNGDVGTPEIVFEAGDVVMEWVPG